jgi:hypothetical protein
VTERPCGGWPRVVLEHCTAVSIGALIEYDQGDNSILDVAWYPPKEAVPGVEHPAPLRVADGLATHALAEAARLAEAQNAAALLVVHKGRLVFNPGAPRLISGRTPMVGLGPLQVARGGANGPKQLANKALPCVEKVG